MDTDRNLLAALLAVHNEMVSRDDVQALFSRWLAAPQEDFIDWLCKQGKLARANIPRLESLVFRTLEQHHGDVQAGLKSLSPTGDWLALTPSQIATVGGAAAGLPLPPAVAPITVPGRPSAKPASPPADSRSRYVRLRLHAAGGIGQVFLARDTRLDRDVALKELKPDAIQDPSMGWRFLKEAHITGQLEHPGIVPVYELVTDEEGAVPYYVMRFLRGRTLSQAIHEYHQKRKTGEATLERAALLNAFSTVCQTVAFAHSRGIIHRDLKGANILLGNFGEVAVLDWGLAKKLSSAESTSLRDKVSATLDLHQTHEFERTLEGQVLGTPYYMSPEQATGKAVDTRSDVYSLGAILYEILAGQPPFAQPGNQSLGIRELLERIGTIEPIAPRQLVPEAPRALEAVCLRAMEKDPAERYAGAGELGQEVQRWLADEPVRAYPEPLTARIGRWARRNRVLVASAAILLSITVIGLSIFNVLLHEEQGRTRKALDKATEANTQLTLEQKRTEEARARAEANFKKAQDAVDQYLTKIGEERLLNEPGLQDLRRELLASAQNFYVDFARDQGNDAAGRLALGEAKLKLAQIHATLGERKEAVKFREEALDIFRDLHARDADADICHYKLAQCYVELAGLFFQLKGPLKETEDLAEKARTELTALVQRKPLPRYRHLLAESHNTLAAILTNRWRAADGADADKLRTQAVIEQKAAVQIWEKLLEEQPDNPAWPQYLSGGLGNLGPLFKADAEKKEAEMAFTTAVSLLEKLVDKYPKSMEYQNRLGGAYRNLGLHHFYAGAPIEAERFLRRAVKVRDRLARQNPHVPEFHFKAAGDHFQLAECLILQGRSLRDKSRENKLAQARASYRRCIAIYQRLAEDYPDDSRYLTAWSHSLNSMIDNLEAALKLGEKSAEHIQALADAYEGRGLVQAREGRLQPALADLDRAVELLEGDRRNAAIDKRQPIRIRYVVELQRKKGDFAAAAREIAKVTAEPLLTPEKRFGAARILAISAAMADDVKSPLAEQYAAEVVELLRQARKEKVFDNPEYIQDVEELNRLVPPLARRPDFRELLRELKKKQ